MSTRVETNTRGKKSKSTAQNVEQNDAIVFIQHIILQNYRSFKHAKINFFELKSAILGPNSAGKSNIIDSIQFCLCAKHIDGDLSEYINTEASKHDPTSVELVMSNNQRFKRIISNKTISFFINGATVNQKVYMENVTEVFKIQTDQQALSLSMNQRDSHILNVNFLSKLLETDGSLAIEYEEANENYNAAAVELKGKNAKFQLQKKKVQNFATDEEVLKEQAETRKQLEKCQYQHSLIQLYSLQKQFGEIIQVTNELERKLQEIEQQNSTQTSVTLATTKEEIQQLHTQLQKLKLQQQDIKNKVDIEITPALQMEKANSEILKRQLQNSQKTLSDKTLEQIKLKGQIKDLEKEQNEVNQKLKQFTQDNFEIPQVFLEKQQEFQQTNQKLLSSLKDIEYKEKKLSMEFEQLQTKMQALEQRDQAIQIKLDSIDLSIQEKEKKLQNETMSFQEYSQEVEKLRQQIKSNNLIITNIMSNLQQLNSQLANNIDYQRLINQEKRYQSVMDRIKSDVVYGYVYDLFKVKNSQYQEMINFISSGFKYSVVCQNFSSVQKILQIIKQLKIQLQFLPLSKLQAQESEYDVQIYRQNEMCKECKFATLEPILNLIEFDQKYNAAFFYIFKNFFLIKDQNFERNTQKVKQLNEFCKKNNVRAVSLSNVIYSGKGVIQFQVASNNRQTNNQSIRNVDIEQLSRNKTQLEQQLADLESKNLAAQTKQQIIQNNQMTLCQKNQDAINTNLQNLIQEKQVLKRQQEQIKSNIDYLANQSQSIEQSKNEQKQEMSKIESQIYGLQLKFYTKYNLTKEIIEKAQFQTKQKNVLQSDLQKVQVTITQKNNLLHHVETDINRVQQFIQQTTQKQNQSQQNITDLNAQLQKATSESNSVQQQINQKNLELQGKKDHEIQLQNQIQQHTVNKMNLEQQLQRQNTIKAQKTEILNGILETIYINGIQISSNSDTQISKEIASYLSAKQSIQPYQFLINLQIDFTDAKYILRDAKKNSAKSKTKQTNSIEQPDVPDDENEKLSTAILQLLMQIDQLQMKLNHETKVGVSLKTIEREKQRLEEFENEVRAAKKDLQQLHQVLGQKSETRRLAFTARLDNFREIFGETYSKLTDFQGRVILTEIDMLKPFLDGGLDLIVQPPGDKINKPSELSGGEQALVRFALTFSLAKLNGQKLLLLDEIDQNLDADRVSKVQILLNAEKNMQILAVTHNPALATFADQLIGVAKGQIFWLQVQSAEKN